MTQNSDEQISTFQQILLPQWLRQEIEVIKNDRKKIAQIKADNGKVPLWHQIHTRLGAHIAEHKLRDIDTALLKSAQLSVQSSIGNSSERLFKVLSGLYATKPDQTDHLTHYILSHTFSDEIAKLRALHAEGKSTDEVVVRTAGMFFVTTEFIESFLSNLKKERTYPDSVSRFADGTVHIAEHKLSGDNDSKAVTKNLSVLAGLKEAFCLPNQTVKTGVVLTFSDTAKSYKARWANKGSADGVYANEEVWEFLYRVPAADSALYAEIVNSLAIVGAHRMFAFIAPEDLELDTVSNPLEWKWVKSTG